MAKGLFGGLFGGQGLQMVGKLTKQNMECRLTYKDLIYAN